VTEKAYAIAKERYAELGVDTEAALAALASRSVSVHCWQGDDVAGFEAPDAALSGGGIQVTGSHPGRARNPEELRSDLEKALSLVPGRHRLNLHAIYGEFGGVPVDRDAVAIEHFRGWIDWARERKLGLDFNATLFSHPRADAGFTLSSKDAATRRFWIAHVRRCREIAAHMGADLDTPCIHNLWIPDGMKDQCVDRAGHRALLRDSLDAIYDRDASGGLMKDAVESKLFGIGSESFVVGSHEFYLGYAMEKGLLPCLDLGHFHPTESVADKISALLPFFPELLLHVSRGVRWDSDHVVILDDPVREVALEIVRADALDRVHLALDFFDASLNRVGAWVTGIRATIKALLFALLEPTERLRALETEGDYLGRMALLEELRAMPFGAVWDHHCARSGVPVRGAWIEPVRDYEKQVLSNRPVSLAPAP
jgi:L-rhamnose isomerase